MAFIGRTHLCLTACVVLQYVDAVIAFAVGLMLNLRFLKVRRTSRLNGFADAAGSFASGLIMIAPAIAFFGGWEGAFRLGLLWVGVVVACALPRSWTGEAETTDLKTAKGSVLLALLVLGLEAEAFVTGRWLLPLGLASASLSLVVGNAGLMVGMRRRETQLDVRFIVLMASGLAMPVALTGVTAGTAPQMVPDVFLGSLYFLVAFVVYLCSWRLTWRLDPRTTMRRLHTMTTAVAATTAAIVLLRVIAPGAFAWNVIVWMLIGWGIVLVGIEGAIALWRTAL